MNRMVCDTGRVPAIFKIIILFIDSAFLGLLFLKYFQNIYKKCVN